MPGRSMLHLFVSMVMCHLARSDAAAGKMSGSAGEGICDEESGGTCASSVRPSSSLRLGTPALNSCPPNWLASPVDASWPPKCYYSPPYLTSHLGCANACTMGGFVEASLACVSSAEENAYVSENLLKFLRANNPNRQLFWIGLYRDPKHTHRRDYWRGSWAAHQRCGSARLQYRNWSASQPDARLGQEDCVAVDDSGGWHDLTCYRQEYRCLCELGAQATTGYRQDVMELEEQAARAAWIAVWPAVWKLLTLIMAPAFTVLTWMMVEHGIRCSSDSSGFKWSAEQGLVLRRLHVASECLTSLRLRTSHALAQLGWTMILCGWFPMTCQYHFGYWPERSLGYFHWYMLMVPWGGVILALSIQPIDKVAVCVAAVGIMLLWLGLSASSILFGFRFLQQESYSLKVPLLWFSVGIGNFLCAGGLLISIKRHAIEAPRLLLQDVWLYGRIDCGTAGVAMYTCLITTRGYSWFMHFFMHDGTTLLDPYVPGAYLVSFSFFMVPLIMTPAVRAEIREYLACQGRAKMTPGAVTQQHHSLAASLIALRHTSPERSLESATRLFKCCELVAMPVGTDPKSALASLSSTCRPARFGEVDAFISHSQADDERIKWHVLSEWARDFRQRHRRWPLVWYDRACMDSARFPEESIAALPLMITGCRRLLVLAGPTYASRLWALVEILVFLWSQDGCKDQIQVLPLLPSLPLQQRQPVSVGARRGAAGILANKIGGSLLQSFLSLSLESAKCAYTADRQLMLAAIETIFGDARDINELLAGILCRGSRGALGCADQQAGYKYDEIVASMPVVEQVEILQAELRERRAELTDCRSKLSIVQTGYARLRRCVDKVAARDHEPAEIKGIKSMRGNTDTFVDAIARIPLPELKLYQNNMNDRLHTIQKEIREKEKAEAEDKQCLICMERDKNTALNCGHRLCGVCAMNVQLCPVCRVHVTHRIPLF